MDSYVYVIASSPEGPVKVGCSKHPDKRLKQLQTGHSEVLELAYTTAVPAAQVRLMERVIHETNRHRKVHGEWFDLTVENAILEVRCAVMQYGDELETTMRNRTF